MATVIFHGDLQQFGNSFNLKVDSASEALRALFCQIGGLRQHLQNGGYFVRVADKDVTPDSIKDDFSSSLNDDDVIHVVPQITGAGKYGQIIMGAILIAAAVFCPPLAPFAGAMMMAGAGMIVGGITQLLMKPPEFGTKEIDSNKSSSFNNLGNQAAEGSCIPLAYGYIRCGAKTISQSIESYSPIVAPTTELGEI